MLLLALLVFGLFVGWIAQMLLGLGTRPDGRTLAAGLVGSFVGGLLASLVAGDGLSLRPSGLIGSLVGAVIVLLVWTRLAPAPASGRGSRR
ncbi:MAG TPA: GlsB/YeaQ/YmgE family stress response membrane protein [Acidimicrobiales bacterium]|nr:GlsB/YeaQ/YmgE family stress response membrane protein [Acidimicrobiales bacterium]